MLQPSGVKIWRPRQLYLGEGQRDYIEEENRQQKSDAGAFGAPSQVSHGGDSKRNQLATYKDERGDIFKPKL
jgi:citrate synthase